MSSILDMKLSDAPRQREIPDGLYRGVVTKFENLTVGENETEKTTVTFKPIEALEDQDLTDVNMKGTFLRKDYWLTPNALKILTSDLDKYTKKLPGDTAVRDVFAELVGEEIGIVVATETFDGKNGPGSKKVVKSIRRLKQ